MRIEPTVAAGRAAFGRYVLGSKRAAAALALGGALAAQAQPPEAAPAGGPEAFQGGVQTIVVTASRVRQQLAEAPAAMTVISGEEIAQAPADDFGDLLRNVPGLNVAQTSVRDINMTGRGATSTLANSTLVMLDGRSVYLDFFGLVMWDLLPIQASEVDRIEVVRGPGSAVWGANAMTGVVNVITRRPKDMLGTTVVVGTPYASIVHAGVSGRLGYKVSAGYFEQPAYERPTGVIPGSVPPQTYPTFANEGTEQARINAELEWDTGEDAYVSVGAGYASTDGILHSGIGPFDIDHGSSLSYVKADWHRGDWRIGFGANFLDGSAVNLLTRAADGSQLPLSFVSDTYSLDVSNTSALGSRHTLTYGADYRTTAYELDIAPTAANRGEWGTFVQDEMRLGERLRWVLGARYDRVDPLEDAVWTPRTSLLITLSPRRTLRISYNEAFRTPSAINSYLATSILQQLGPYGVSADAIGNAGLREEHLKAYELGYVATLSSGPVLTVAVYRNKIEDSIDFFIRGLYGPTNLPAPSPFLPAAVVPCFNFAPGTGPGACPFGGLAGLVPSDYSYRNLGGAVNRGVEFSLQGATYGWDWFANVSWQDEPRISGQSVDPADVNVPPAWRANLGVGRDTGGRFWSAEINYQGEAYWADVLFARASTPAFTQVNAAVGWRVSSDRWTVKLVGQNLFDERVQQHIFGDILGRKLAAETTYRF